MYTLQPLAIRSLHYQRGYGQPKDRILLFVMTVHFITFLSIIVDNEAACPAAVQEFASILKRVES